MLRPYPECERRERAEALCEAEREAYAHVTMS
jgi:hypothetical protein